MAASVSTTMDLRMDVSWSDGRRPQPTAWRERGRSRGRGRHRPRCASAHVLALFHALRPLFVPADDKFRALTYRGARDVSSAGGALGGGVLPPPVQPVPGRTPAGRPGRPDAERGDRVADLRHHRQGHRSRMGRARPVPAGSAPLSRDRPRRRPHPATAHPHGLLRRDGRPRGCLVLVARRARRASAPSTPCSWASGSPARSRGRPTSPSCPRWSRSSTSPTPWRGAPRSGRPRWWSGRRSAVSRTRPRVAQRRSTRIAAGVPRRRAWASSRCMTPIALRTRPSRRPAIGARRRALRLAQRDRAGRDLARSVRGAARRRDGAPAHLRARHPAPRSVGARHPARRACRRRRRHRRDRSRCGRSERARAPRCSRVSPCSVSATVVFGLSRSFALSLAALVVVGAADMVSVVVRSVAHPAGDSRCDARPGERRQHGVHRRQQRARRVRVGADRPVVRRRSGRSSSEASARCSWSLSGRCAFPSSARWTV